MPTLTCLERRADDGWNKVRCPAGQVSGYQNNVNWNNVNYPNNNVAYNNQNFNTCYTPVCNGPGAFVKPSTATSCGECGQRPAPPMNCMQRRSADGWGVENCPAGTVRRTGINTNNLLIGATG
jgi:hypothetical protein